MLRKTIFFILFLQLVRGNEDFQRQGGDGETCFTKECIAASHRYVIFLKYPVWWTGFFPSLKTNCIFLPVQTGFFPSFWSRVKYFDGPCLTIYSLFTIYRDTHYQFLVWWIHYTHCCESKKLKPGKFCLCSLWNNIFNYPNWDFGFC